jgi:hypothetical protein
LQQYLTVSLVDWNRLDETAQRSKEDEWRSIFGKAFRALPGRRWRPRFRRGAKAEYEYLSEPTTNFLIVPFSSNIKGLPMHLIGHSMGAYECHGKLLPLGAFCEVEFFISSIDFQWTMVHTHEDYAIDGPFFIRKEWVR